MNASLEKLCEDINKKSYRTEIIAEGARNTELTIADPELVKIVMKHSLLDMYEIMAKLGVSTINTIYWDGKKPSRAGRYEIIYNPETNSEQLIYANIPWDLLSGESRIRLEELIGAREPSAIYR